MTGEIHAALLRSAFGRAIIAVTPANCLPQFLPGPADGRTYLIALGKAAAAMAEIAAGQLEIAKALVIYPDGHGPTHPLPPQFELVEAGHPIPDARGLRAAERALELARELHRKDRLIALISGGGSALLSAPSAGVSLADKQRLTRALLNCGASIAEINCVRQCLSRIKGGRLAKAADGAEVLTLVVSDVPGDDPSLVASGPTLASTATLPKALSILGRYRIEVPDPVREALKDPSNAPVCHLANAGAKLVAVPVDALRAAAAWIERQGFEPVIFGDSIEGEARELAKADSERARNTAAGGRRMALIAGGEASVRLTEEPPPGGRNLEYALALALELDGHPHIWALACDSDGIDGSTPAAGAIVGPNTLKALKSAGVDALDSLQAHQAYAALDATGALVVTGPTRTNVNDIRIILVDPDS